MDLKVFAKIDHFMGKVPFLDYKDLEEHVWGSKDSVLIMAFQGYFQHCLVMELEQFHLPKFTI